MPRSSMGLQKGEKEAEEKELDAQHHDFMSVVHIFETNPRFSNRSLPSLYKNYRIFTPIAHHGTGNSDLPNHLMKYIRRQRESGVLINYAWPMIQYDPIKWRRKVHFLAQYCGFSGSEEMTAYADTIGKYLLTLVPITCDAYYYFLVSDIIPEAALVASNSRLGCRDVDDGDLPHSMV